MASGAGGFRPPPAPASLIARSRSSMSKLLIASPPPGRSGRVPTVCRNAHKSAPEPSTVASGRRSAACPNSTSLSPSAGRLLDQPRPHPPALRGRALLRGTYRGAPLCLASGRTPAAPPAKAGAGRRDAEGCTVPRHVVRRLASGRLHDASTTLTGSNRLAAATAEIPLQKRSRGDGRCLARTVDLLLIREEQLLRFAALCLSSRSGGGAMASVGGQPAASARLRASTPLPRTRGR